MFVIWKDCGVWSFKRILQLDNLHELPVATLGDQHNRVPSSTVAVVAVRVYGRERFHIFPR